MNALPEACEVLVVGAGPAGSACALALARQGRDVVLVDAQVFPRDKVCGDALIPDAHAALRRLGVYDEVMAQAHAVSHVRCRYGRSMQLDVPGNLAVLPRRKLDELLRQAALRAGARWAAPWRFDACLEAEGRVVGARLLGEDGVARELRCRWLVLATGAVPQALIAAGMCQRRAPSGVSLRGYRRLPGLERELPHLQMHWHRRLPSGYGWIFPVGQGVFNIGTIAMGLHRPGTDDQARASKRALNLRESLDRYAECDPHARALLREGTEVGPVKGAPLRCTLDGARPSRPGLLVTGEAAGSTYALTGEGIGKAIETGLLAAQAVLQQAADAETCAAYDAALAALRPRFVMYRRANIVNEHPWIAGAVMWRARRSPRLLARMAGVLDETANPGHLVTWKGVYRLLSE